MKIEICVECKLEKKIHAKGLCDNCYQCKFYRTSIEYKEYKRKYDKEYHKKYYPKHKERKLKISKEYYKNNKQKAKENHRRIHLKKYNITTEHYEKLFIEQNGKCKICGNISKDKNLSVDHCHITGRVRGLLCYRCNTFVGMVENCNGILELAGKYLNENIN